jgi:hypothetical protein
MSKVQPLPKYKIDDEVIMLDKQRDDDGVVVDTAALQTIVVDRLYTSELGWLYRCAGIGGLMEERNLKAYDTSTVSTHIADPNGVYGCINTAELLEALPDCPFKPGDYATTLEQLENSNELLMTHVVIIGIYWEDGEWSFDTALLNDQGNFVDVGLWYYEEALEPLDPETMEATIREKRGEKAKPKLSLVHSR